MPRGCNGAGISSVLLCPANHERESEIDHKGRDDQERNQPAREDHEHLSMLT
jgi:hypothetical protein